MSAFQYFAPSVGRSGQPILPPSAQIQPAQPARTPPLGAASYIQGPPTAPPTARTPPTGAAANIQGPPQTSYANTAQHPFVQQPAAPGTTAAAAPNFAPPVYSPLVQNSTDPGVYNSPNYSMQQNQTWYQGLINQWNAQLASQYQQQYQQWQAGGSQGAAPTAPQYYSFNQNAYNDAWKNVGTTGLGTGSSFITAPNEPSNYSNIANTVSGLLNSGGGGYYGQLPTATQPPMQQPAPAAAPANAAPAAAAAGATPLSTASTAAAPNAFAPTGGAGSGTNNAPTMFGAPSGGTAGSFNPYAAIFGQTPDQKIAQTGGAGANALQTVIGTGGAPINATPAWQAMIAAENRNVQEQAANLAAQFGASGNAVSSPFGTAMSDYWTQTALGQNAQLTAAQTAALESAANRYLSAGTTAAGGLGQLSSQGFQSQMQQFQDQFAAAQSIFGQGSTAAQQLSQQAAAAAMGLNTGAINELQNVTGASAGATGALNTAAIGAGTNLYNTQNQAALSQVSAALQSMGLGIQGTNALDQLWMSNLGLGNQLGGTQTATNQQQLNNLYQYWLSIQPQNNPLLPYMFGAATGYPATATPGYAPGAFGSLLSGLGSILGAAALF